MRYSAKHFVLVLAIISLPTFGSLKSVLAEENFFEGKTITYIVATKPGGGYDAYGRLVAKYMEKHIPGATFVVQNVPGAGHVIGTNQLYAAAPDGLTVGTFNTGLIYGQVMELDGIEFDLQRMGWIGKAASDSRVLVVGKESGFRSFEELQSSERPILLASSGFANASHIDSLLLSRALDFPIKMVLGFSGNEAEMSIMRGDEIDGMIGSFSSLRPFVENGYGRYLLRVGEMPGPPIPDARDLVDSDEGAAMVNLIASRTQLGRLTAGPPGIPADRLKRLRGAYRTALDDPDLRAEAKRMKIPIVPLDGAVLAQRIDGALNQPNVTREVLRSLKPE